MFSLYLLRLIYHFDVAVIPKKSRPVLAELSAFHLKTGPEEHTFLVAASAGHHGDSRIFLFRITLKGSLEVPEEGVDVEEVSLPEKALKGENRDPFFFAYGGKVYLGWVHTDYILRKVNLLRSQSRKSGNHGTYHLFAEGPSEVLYSKLDDSFKETYPSRILLKMETDLAYPCVCGDVLLFSKVEGITLKGYFLPLKVLMKGFSLEKAKKSVLALNLPPPVEDLSCVKLLKGACIVAFRNFSTLRIFAGKSLSRLKEVSLPPDLYRMYVMAPRLSVDSTGKYKGIVLSFHGSQDAYLSYSRADFEGDPSRTTFGKPFRIRIPSSQRLGKPGKFVRLKNPSVVWLGDYLVVFVAVEQRDRWLIKALVYSNSSKSSDSLGNVKIR